VLAYVDTSAFLKLVHDERESAALHADLPAEVAFVSSTLLTVEARRAAARYDGRVLERTRALLDTFALLPLDDPVLERAATLEPLALRSLDALHLATALSIGPAHLTLYTYDDRLADAAAAHGFPVRAPGT